MLRCADVIENADQLILDEATLLLDHEHILQAFGKRKRAAHFQRPGQRNLQKMRNAQSPALRHP